MEKIITPFEFNQCINIVKSTGYKAANLREFRDALSSVSTASIFHHTCQYFLKGHILEYTNDFAHWAGEALEERALAEHLSNIDSYAFRDIDELRGVLIGVVDGYLEQFPEPRVAMPGSEFYFNETVTLKFPVGVKARNLAEFLMAIKYIDPGCIYYHFYEARVRLGGGVDDFTRWFDEALGITELADVTRSIDPFMHNIDGIRTRIADAVELEVRRSMEVAEK